VRRRRRIVVAAADADAALQEVMWALGPALDVEVVAPMARRLVPRRSTGYMEREPGRLQVRYSVARDEHIDDVVHAEDDETVVVLGTVCTPALACLGGRTDCPTHVYLEAPLGGREVIDGVTGEPVPFRDVYADMAAEGILEPMPDGNGYRYVGDSTAPGVDGTL
jgi:hypothetical protein